MPARPACGARTLQRKDDRRMRKILILLAAAILLSASACSATTLTYVDLVNRLIDLESLAVLPVPGEKTEQASSYDRASRYDEASGKYYNWDANGDGNGHIRMEGNQTVMAEIPGPGVIWRIWSARAGEGHIRIYLDGAEQPAVDLPFSGYFNRQNEPFTYPGLVYEAASGMNSYVPIPFQKSCRIVADPDWGVYYHFTYTRFPEGTQLPTFRRELGLKEKLALARVSDFLQNAGGRDPAGVRAGQQTLRLPLAIRPGETSTIADLPGPRAITAIRLRLPDLSPTDERDVLRSAVLRIRWDGEKEPSVWVPLGDFFGTAPGINEYRSLPLGATRDELYSLWYMPFASRAQVEILNESRQSLRGEILITHAPLARPVSSLGRFHAKWHRDAFLPEDPDRRKIDWTMLITRGRGRFAGVMLEVWNPLGGWWGEGDEKFFVDGEKFPSTFGTGSEDYFGYAWCNPTLFQRGLHNQTISMGNKGHISVNRWHIADNVPFQKSFEAAIEKYFPNDRPTLYAATVYWYLQPGGEDPYPSVPLRDRTGWYIGSQKPWRAKGVLEGEEMKVIASSRGQVSTQDLGGRGHRWSNDRHLWWTQAAPGDTLDLEIPVRENGRYEISAQFTKAPDYGIVQLWMNGQKLGSPLDLYHPEVVTSGEMVLGEVDLPSGAQTLRVQITGANEQAIKSHMFGLDYVRLKRR